MSSLSDSNWDINIDSSKKALGLNLNEIYKYKDLLILLIKKDIITIYKQTILGPAWFILQPLMTTLIFLFIFSNVANLSTDGIPGFLFYLSGITSWNLFSSSITKNSKTFLENMNVFSKVYFPRIVVPLSKCFSAFIEYFIQLLLFICFFIYYKYFNQHLIELQLYIVLLPIYLIMLSLSGLGIGLLFSSLTSKYRDFKFLIEYGVRLAIYLTPVAFPLSSIPEGKMKTIFQLNPISHIIEAMRFSFFGKGEFNELGLIYAFTFSIIMFLLGYFIFNRTEKTFIDNV